MSATRNSKSSKGLNVKLPNVGSLFLGVLTGIGVTCLLISTFATKDITLKIPVKSAKPKAITQHNISANPIDVAAVESPKAEIPTTPQEPRFDFYTELTRTSHEANAELQHKSHVLDLKTAAKPIDRYVVQAGSFKRRSDADALKATLTLNGFDARIEMTKIDDAIWHRVVLGPFKTEALAREQKQLLKTIEVEGILVLKHTD